MARGPRIREAAWRWWILVAMGSSLGIVLLDEVLVGVALPTIREELGLSPVVSRWVVNAYVLALTAFVAAAGRLGDILGHRWVFVGGGVAVCIGSLGAGFADSAALMLASRVVEGLGAATMLSLSIAMTGMMQMKMPANSFATSRIGPQLKPLAWRYSFLVT